MENQRYSELREQSRELRQYAEMLLGDCQQDYDAKAKTESELAEKMQGIEQIDAIMKKLKGE